MSIVVFTSITLNYLPKAQVLARSLKRHHPDMHFGVVLAEPADSDLLAYEPAFDEIVTPDDLPLPDREAWLFQHSVVEACTALKGYALEHWLKRPGVESVIYLDPDIVVFDRLDPVLELLAGHDVVLTPHLCEPETDEAAIADNEICALRHGVFNMGFLGVANRPEGHRFADWWRSRLEKYCRADIAQGLFTDQRWIDLVPAFFPGAGVLRHPGCNVATWNLTRRRIEGDAAHGFTVNGQPLIFYHFSGFDNGAQLAMLRRYGADMPAAFQLRRWYVEETARVDARGYHRRRWRYDHFDNGAAIRPAQRATYREQADLRRRFPRPFNTAGESYWAWMCERGLAGDGLPAGPRALTALERYIREPALHSCSPHPWFDGAYYSRTHPNVAVLRITPLEYYVRFGHSDSNGFHPRFDPDYYRSTQPPGAAPIVDLLLDFELNERRGRPNPLFDPILDAPIVSQWHAARTPNLPALLRIQHYGGGGVSLHVHQLAGYIAGRAQCLLLTPMDRGWLRLEMEGCSGLPPLWWDAAEGLDSLCGVLRDFGVARLHVHHTLGNEVWLEDFVARMARPYDVTLHDYYFLAPQWHLTGADGRFVGDEHMDDGIGWPMDALTEWRTRARRFLAGAQRVLAPSRDLAERYRRHYPELRLHVAPHLEEPRPESVPVHPRPCVGTERLRVVLIGYLQPHKGGPLVLECARLARERNLPIEFHVIGLFDTPLPDESNLKIHGAYEPQDLPALLRTADPHLVWQPAQCPESYSYTLSEALQAGLPVLASNLGALPERLSGRPWSWVFPWNAGPNVWLDRMMEIRERYFVRGNPAPAVGSPPDWDVNFYRDRYLDWI